MTASVMFATAAFNERPLTCPREALVCDWAGQETETVRRRGAVKSVLGGVVVTLGVLSILVAPAFARVAVIGTAVPLADDSEPAVHAAVAEALDFLARGAQAMGLSHLQLTRATIVEHTVVIAILATDTPAESEPDASASPDESAPPSTDDASTGTKEWL